MNAIAGILNIITITGWFGIRLRGPDSFNVVHVRPNLPVVSGCRQVPRGLEQQQPGRAPVQVETLEKHMWNQQSPGEFHAGKPKIPALANHIGRKKPGAKDVYGYDTPEYRILEPVVTDDMAEVCMTMAIREKMTAETVSQRCGRSEEECHRLLLELLQSLRKGLKRGVKPPYLPGVRAGFLGAAGRP